MVSYLHSEYHFYHQFFMQLKKHFIIYKFKGKTLSRERANIFQGGLMVTFEYNPIHVKQD